MSTADDALTDAVRGRVTDWQALAGRIATGQEHGTARHSDVASCAHAARVRSLLTDDASREALLGFVDAVLVPASAAEGAARHADAHAELLDAGMDLPRLAAARAREGRAVAEGQDAAPGHTPRRGVGGLLAGLGDRFDSVTARVAPHRTVTRAALHLRTILGGPSDLGGFELEDDIADLAGTGIGVDAELVTLPVVGPAGADRYAAEVRRDLLGMSGRELRSVTVRPEDPGPELLGPAAGLRRGERPAPAALAQFAERLRPLLRASRESGIDLVLARPAVGAGHVLDVLVELAREPEFAYVTAHLTADPAADPEFSSTVDRLLGVARERVAAGGHPMGLRLERGARDRTDGEAGADAFHAALEQLVRPETARLLDVVVASDHLDDHAYAQVLADERPGASSPRAHVSPLCPPERAATLARDLDVTATLFVVPSPPDHDSEEAGAVVATATARVVHRLAALADPDRPAHPRGGPVRALGDGDASAPEVLPAAADALAPLSEAEARDLAHEARLAGEQWARVAPRLRAEGLERAAAGLAAIGRAEAATALRMLAGGARALDRSADGIAFEPDRLVVAVPATTTPATGAAISAAGALAAGAAAIVLVPPHAAAAAQEVAAVLREALAEVGAPAGILRVLPVAQPPRALLDLDEVDMVTAADPVLARTVEAWRAGGPGGPRVLGGPAGPSAMIITPAAQPELAAADLVASAFAAGGRVPGSISMGVLVGSAASSARVRGAIVDAVAALPPMPASDEDESPELQRARSLDIGETWLVEPRRLSAGGAWTPGVKTGVAAASHTASARLGGPVLGLLDVADLEDAVRIVNQARGLVAACWSLRTSETAEFTETAQAPHLVLRRAAVGGVLPAHGAAAGAGTAGWDGAAALGADLPARLGRWIEEDAPTRLEEPADPVRAALIDYTGLVADQVDRSWLRAAVASDAFVWSRSLVRIVDTAGSGPDVVLVRHRAPAHVWVRAGEGTAVVELLRVLLAAEAVGVEVRVSLCPGVSAELKAMDSRGEPARLGLRRLTPLVDRVEDVSSFAARIRSGTVTGRIRALGADTASLPGLVAGRGVDLAAQPVLAHGASELPALLQSQTLSRPRRLGAPG